MPNCGVAPSNNALGASIFTCTGNCFIKTNCIHNGIMRIILCACILICIHNGHLKMEIVIPELTKWNYFQKMWQNKVSFFLMT